MKRTLNIRQERFCELVASGNSATQAYIEAGYKVSEKVAGTNGPRLLENAGVRSRVRELRAPQTRRALMSRDFKRERLREIVESNVSTADKIRAMAEDSRWPVITSQTERKSMLSRPPCNPSANGPPPSYPRLLPAIAPLNAHERHP